MSNFKTFLLVYITSWAFDKLLLVCNVYLQGKVWETLYNSYLFMVLSCPFSRRWFRSVLCSWVAFCCLPAGRRVHWKWYYTGNQRIGVFLFVVCLFLLLFWSGHHPVGPFRILLHSKMGMMSHFLCLWGISSQTQWSFKMWSCTQDTLQHEVEGSGGHA